MDFMDDDAKWRSIISDMDKELSQRLYNAVSAILPFSMLEDDLQHAQCAQQGFQNMIRSQTAHLLYKKGPRTSKEREQKNNIEEEPLNTSESISHAFSDGKAVKMRYKAKNMAERKVVASLFHFLWPLVDFWCNPIAVDVRPSSSNMRRKCL